MPRGASAHRTAFIAAPATMPDGRTDDGADPAHPKTPRARPSGRRTTDNGRLPGAINGCRKGKCVVIGRFSCRAPSERRAGAAGVDRFAMEYPGAGLSAGLRVREPAPGKDATFPGKPRNPDKCLHAHASCLAQNFLFLNRDGGRCRCVQNIANATTISPNMPTAMVIFVAVSIVVSVKPLALSSA